ncbi:MAG: TrmH family RNA methyltransferase, partial [Pyrinomonadaceae bacterium]
MTVISSRQNPIIQRARRVRSAAEHELIFIEGVRLAEDGVKSSLKIVDALVAESVNASQRRLQLIEELRDRNIRIHIIEPKLMGSLSEAKTSQGVILLAERPAHSQDYFVAQIKKRRLVGDDKNLLLIVLGGVGNPSNAGAIVRVAEAAGAHGVISTQGTTDLFSPRSLRGAMGSSFRLPCWTGADFTDVVAYCAQVKIRLVYSELHATVNHTAYDWKQGTALLLGSESYGIGVDMQAVIDAHTNKFTEISIPMRKPVESL